MKKIILIIAVMLLFAACSKEEGTNNDDNNNDTTTNNSSEDTTKAGSVEGFSYEQDGVGVVMNADAAPIVEALGEPVEYFEAASCAFQGLDKIYYYNGFELGTYPMEDKDYVSYVNLLDDSVSTEKGVFLGSTLEDVIAAYGEDYTIEGTSYVYRMGESKMTFIIEEDAVTSITYYAIVEGLNN